MSPLQVMTNTHPHATAPADSPLTARVTLPTCPQPQDAHEALSLAFRVPGATGFSALRAWHVGSAPPSPTAQALLTLLELG